jgi:MraZ protein
MFRGNCPTRLDEKGRLKMPADFKREIDEKYGAQFYITSTDGKIAQIYPLEAWERKEQKIATQPSMNPALRKFLDTTSYYGQVVEMDTQGRLLLPTTLRDKAGLKNIEVSVVGKLERLDLRVAEEFRKQVEENPITPEDEDALAQLGI